MTGTTPIVIFPFLVGQQPAVSTGTPSGPPPPGSESAGTLAGGTAEGVAGEGPSPSPFGGGGFFYFLIILMVVMIAFSVFGGRKQRKRREALLRSLKKHDSVLTRGGVFGSIVDIDDDRVVLKVDEASNTRITVVRDSIDRVFGEQA
ncbi:MAG: preprotein translocase subunit YajC [Phycisphaerales bacterium]|jgi:preprotein translocase subunit YajC|nr:preprotein translocase subunit YajC [Phycisphaerales bacterium]MDP6987134.1 preprotein translocase subunit YajC [Phycisphaerales bacterium]